MVVSNVEAPLSPPCARLPTLTRWRPTRPVIGASTWLNSTLSWAAFSAPSAMDLGGVRGLQGLAALVDDLFGDRALDQAQPTIESRLASSALARASDNWPSACSATASNGRESIK